MKELLLVTILVLFHCTLGQQGFLKSRNELSALLDLRSSLGIRSTDWPIKSGPCKHWTGIQCRDGRVIGINISGLKRTRVGLLNPSFSVDSLVNCTFLESFNASGFSLPGSIPKWFGYRLGSLKVLDLQSSSVTGPIPASLGNLTRLKTLYLGSNDLAGSLPAALGQLMQLSGLDLSRNSLTGQLPSEFGLLRNLSKLDLSCNYFSGSIPSTFGSISSLKILNLSNNSLMGSVPVELGNLSNLVELNLGMNGLSGLLPVELMRLRNLEVLVLRDNRLEGRLPDGLFSSLGKLRVLELRENKFDGALPDALWSSQNLQVLDVSANNFTADLTNSSLKGHASGAVFNLSNNKLYGTPACLSENCTSIDLSGNYFQGKVTISSPRDGSLDMNCLQTVPYQRSLEDCSLFYAERGLTFDYFGNPEPISAPKKRKRWIYILVGLLGGVGFITILVLVIVVVLRKFSNFGTGVNTITNERGSADVGRVPDGDSPPLPKDPTSASSLRDSFTYEQLLGLTSEFSERNLIRHGHSGDLYQGFLEGGIPIVVKRINLHSLKQDSCMMELEFFSKHSHARLVPLLGHCLENENHKLLVYKYMPNRDLAESLYRVTNFEDDDVQASSILLDDKFEVRLGSLSRVRVQEGDLHQSVLTRFLRKSQSSVSDPGTSGSSPATCAHDVYCFGMVLLELVTGKLGISKSDDATTREWLEHTLAQISVYDREPVAKIVDPSMIVDEDLLEEVWAMAIVARSCLNSKPSKRPPMKYVLKALENPLKVVRDDIYSSGRLRTTSSRRSWSAAFFGSWRHSPDNASALGHANTKQPGRAGSRGSSGIEHSSSNKRLSSEIFPEPLEMQEMERLDEH
uniref:Putative LRR receptor-like serine/threonine-protein kinase n=1 Tax=Populus alba TaxID=43335 RepID=A0A4U5QAE1_POPAL|nr:putative LRR receptor-like serine/threonine-protein kinase [Populus alba]